MLTIAFAVVLTASPAAQSANKSESPSQAGSPVAVQGTIAGLLSDDDYPAEAIRNEEQGTAGFRLTVSADGKVTHCFITRSTGSLTLDETTCRIISERGRFTPARDAGGKAISGNFDGRIMWRLPEDAGPPDYLAFGATISEAGVASDCYILAAASGNDAPLRTQQTCEHTPKGLFANVARLSSKKPVEVRMEHQVLRDPQQALSEPLADKLMSRVVIRAQVDGKGRASACEVIETRGTYLPPPTCRNDIAIAADKSGKEVEVRVGLSLYLMGEGGH